MCLENCGSILCLLNRILLRCPLSEEMGSRVRGSRYLLPAVKSLKSKMRLYTQLLWLRTENISCHTVTVDFKGTPYSIPYLLCLNKTSVPTLMGSHFGDKLIA